MTLLNALLLNIYCNFWTKYIGVIFRKKEFFRFSTFVKFSDSESLSTFDFSAKNVIWFKFFSCRNIFTSHHSIFVKSFLLHSFNGWHTMTVPENTKLLNEKPDNFCINQLMNVSKHSGTLACHLLQELAIWVWIPSKACVFASSIKNRCYVPRVS